MLCSLIEDSEARGQCFNAVLQAGGQRVQPPRPAAESEVAEATVIPIEAHIPTKPEAKAPASGRLARRFSAKVKNVRALVRDRQLVLLDNGLLFEGEGPAFKIGDNVDVVKARWRWGNSYTIGRPAGRRMQFQRLQCELSDAELSADTSRKCAALTES